MERVDLIGLMDHLMLGIYQITTYTVMEYINSQTEERYKNIVNIFKVFRTMEDKPNGW